MIKIYNRKTQKFDIEKVAGEGFLKTLYESKVGKIGLELLVKRKIFSLIAGVYCDLKVSSKKINSFIKKYEVNMNESICETKDFKSFNDFFTRKLKEEARPFSSSNKSLLSPGDGRLKVWENINVNKVIQVKGLNYSLEKLISNKHLAKKYDGGTCILLRLAPVDYHRFHFIDDGVCGETKKIKGHYYSVNPIALNNIPEVFCSNKREYCIFKSENFGEILYIEVGATSVGSIIQTYKPNKKIKRGDEKGYFKFGGSTIVLFLEKCVAKIDNIILENTKEGIETKVLAGEIIGEKID